MIFFILPSKRNVCAIKYLIESIKHFHVKEKYTLNKNIKK